VNVDLKGPRGARGRRRLAPDPLDQPVGGDDLVRIEEEEREHRSRPLAERDRQPVAADGLDRSEQSKLHDACRLPPAAR
jgi:hypothetical protein